MGEIVVRSAQTHAELRACVDLQIAVWGFDPVDAVPFNQLHAAHEWGGRVLVAVDDGRVVGFVYGFGGRQYGRPALCSHMLAVLPEYRGRDLGVQLKLAQGRWARANGYDLMTWTYDPLEAVNANLNIGRLGGIARQYLVNHYGELSGGLISGLPTDRLLLEWHLQSPRVSAILDGEVPAASEGALQVEIPKSIQRIKGENPDFALRWRLQVREQLHTALANGYAVTGFRLEPDAGVYLLNRAEEANDSHAH